MRIDKCQLYCIFNESRKYKWHNYFKLATRNLPWKQIPCRNRAETVCKKSNEMKIKKSAFLILLFYISASISDARSFHFHCIFLLYAILLGIFSHVYGQLNEFAVSNNRLSFRSWLPMLYVAANVWPNTENCL